MKRILGIDPGLTHTGWGIITSQNNHIAYVKSGTISPSQTLSLTEKLVYLHLELSKIVAEFGPSESAIEESFVNKNPATSLKLGCARGAIMLSLSLAGLTVGEYPATVVKKAVAGTGKADKEQVGFMMKYLFPGAIITGKDEADALAIAVCHASYTRKTYDR